MNSNNHAEGLPNCFISSDSVNININPRSGSPSDFKWCRNYIKQWAFTNSIFFLVPYSLTNCT